uniref:UPAR/Ly6 domain-containing protein n=1 Tax=Oryzias sinensis TaxID=183150 RepID=A0A8C7WT53_9TELE
MHLFALIPGIWLLPIGDTLRCYQCTPDNLGKCTPTQRECPSETYQCGASRLISYEGGSKIQNQEFKTCFLPEDCGETSVNFGLSKSWTKTQCCNSNLCNTQSVPDSSKTPNGRQCFTCDGSTCDKTLACEGNEDYCVAASGGTITTLKGCVSELCSASNSFPSHLGKISCCKGNLCNSAVTASTGLQLVVVALVSLALFS